MFRRLSNWTLQGVADTGSLVAIVLVAGLVGWALMTLLFLLRIL